MESLMAILIGVLFSVGIYLMLSKSLLRIILGTSILGYGVNLLLITMGGLKAGAPPILGFKHTMFSDPLPQALLLTAIVINFATTALILVLSYRAYQELKTDDMEELRGNINE